MKKWGNATERQGTKNKEQGNVVTSQDALRKYFSSLASSRIAIDSGTHSGWVSRLATSAGHEVIVANPRELRKLHQSDRKNDRADARILARMARFDPELLAPIQLRSAPMQADLTTIRARDVSLLGQVVRDRSQVRRTARHVCMCGSFGNANIEFPHRGSYRGLRRQNRIADNTVTHGIAVHICHISCDSRRWNTAAAIIIASGDGNTIRNARTGADRIGPCCARRRRSSLPAVFQ